MSSRRPVPALPAVDFSRESVIIAAAGQRATGGVGISVQVVRTEGDALLAHVIITQPGRGCIVPQSLSAPVDMLIVSLPRATVRFEREIRLHHCA